MTDRWAVSGGRGVPREMGSCHTAVVGDYVVEGHVPAADIRRLLEEAPDAAGLAVPGMPIGSPGMEQGDTVQPYDVMLLVERLTGNGFNHREGSSLHDTLTGDVRNHGAERIAAEYQTFAAAQSGPVDAAQIVFGVHNSLHPLSRPKAMTAKEREEAEIKAIAKRLNAEAAAR